MNKILSYASWYCSQQREWKSSHLVFSLWFQIVWKKTFTKERKILEVLKSFTLADNWSDSLKLSRQSSFFHALIESLVVREKEKSLVLFAWWNSKKNSFQPADRCRLTNKITWSYLQWINFSSSSTIYISFSPLLRWASFPSAFYRISSPSSLIFRLN